MSLVAAARAEGALGTDELDSGLLDCGAARGVESSERGGGSCESCARNASIAWRRSSRLRVMPMSGSSGSSTAGAEDCESEAEAEPVGKVATSSAADGVGGKGWRVGA